VNQAAEPNMSDFQEHLLRGEERLQPHLKRTRSSCSGGLKISRSDLPVYFQCLLGAAFPGEIF
jgi:hypothetical protein